MIVAARIYIIEFAGLVITPLGVRTVEQKALDFVGGIEGISLLLVEVLCPFLEEAADVGRVRCSAFIDHVAEDQDLAGAKDVGRSPIKGRPVNAETEVAFPLCGKAADR